MFPPDPHFVCRRCGHRFALDPTELKEAGRWARFECPECKFDVSNKGKCQKIAKFYPRLIEAEVQLQGFGIALDGYTLGQWADLPVYWLRTQELRFTCKVHRTNWVLAFDTDVPDLKLRPKQFRSPCGCASRVPPRVIKDFFVCLDQVHSAAIRLTHAQWDLFTPLGSMVPVANLQFPRFRTAA